MMRRRSTTLDGNLADRVNGIALRVVSVLIADNDEKTTDRAVRPEPHFVEKLILSVSGSDRTKSAEVIAEMKRSGISVYDIADRYIPLVAHQLGEAWCADQMDFATVTIGSARLQGLLRGLGPEWCEQKRRIGGETEACLLVVPEGAQHTLGSSLLAGQMRREGVSVHLEVGVSPTELQRLVRQGGYDMVMISASLREKLELLRLMVMKVKDVQRELPVFIGGNVLDQKSDVARITGADLATNDWREALRHCGFKTLENLVTTTGRQG